MKTSATYTTGQILNIYTNNSGVQMRTLLSKYSELIEEVKFYISSGMSRVAAINFTLNEEFAFMFANKSEEKEALKSWMLNKMK